MESVIVLIVFSLILVPFLFRFAFNNSVLAFKHFYPWKEAAITALVPLAFFVVAYHL